MSQRVNLLQALTRRSKRRPVIPITLLCLLAGFLGALSAWPLLSPEVLTIAIIAALLCATVVVRILQGQFDWFEPTIIFVIAWGLLFVARPIGMLLTNSFEASTYQVRQGFEGMLFMALVGGVGFLLAYAAPTGRAVASRLRPPSEPRRAARAVCYGLAIGLIGVILV